MQKQMPIFGDFLLYFPHCVKRGLPTINRRSTQDFIINKINKKIVKERNEQMSRIARKKQDYK
jgi:hypothetical protein